MTFFLSIPTYVFSIVSSSVSIVTELELSNGAHSSGLYAKSSLIFNHIEINVGLVQSLLFQPAQDDTLLFHLHLYHICRH